MQRRSRSIVAGVAVAAAALGVWVLVAGERLAPAGTTAAPRAQATAPSGIDTPSGQRLAATRAAPVSHRHPARDANGSSADTVSEDPAAAADHRSTPAANPGEQEHEPESLDDAPARVVAKRLSEAIERARDERGVPIAAGLVDRVIDEGAVQIIVAQPLGQPPLEPRLTGARHQPAHYYDHIPFAAIEVGPQALLDLVESHDVLGIEEDRLHEPGLAATVPLISAAATTAAGYDGTGRVIAILDTGVDTTHPAFAGRIVDEACFSRIGSCPDGGTREFGPGTGAPCTFGCGHGTLVAGAALGLDPAGVHNGVAPDAGLVSIMVYSNVNGEPRAYTSDVIAALDHVYSLRGFYSFAAVNLSLGGRPFESNASCDAANVARKAAIDLLRSIAVPTIAASGNNGYTDLVVEPACISSAISVGATNWLDGVSGFSNSAGFLSLLAPGQGVETTGMGGGFVLSSGTSISTPHVAGAWAAILEAVPGSNVAEVLFALQSTGQPIVDDRNQLTTPRIDVAAAVMALDAGVDVDDPASAPAAWIPPAADLPEGCGLVGLEGLAVWAVVRVTRRRLRAA